MNLSSFAVLINSLSAVQSSLQAVPTLVETRRTVSITLACGVRYFMGTA